MTKEEVMKNKIIIDCTPISQRYDKEIIDNVCCWAVIQLNKRQQTKWYRRLNPFRHDYLADYTFLENLIKSKEFKQAMKGDEK